MNISRNSWHYKFLMKFGSDNLKLDLRRGVRQFTTCTYIRNVLMTAISISAFVLWLALVIIAAVGVAICTAYTAFTFLSMGFALPPVPTIPLVVGFIGCLIAFVVALFFVMRGMINLICKGLESVHAKTRAKKRIKRDSLVKQAIKDKKDGICTLVKFID